MARSQKICKDFQDCANEILKCLEHQYFKKTEENLMENWSLAILIPAVMYKFENVPKDLDDLGERLSEQSI